MILEQVIGWAKEAGLTGSVHLRERSWVSTPDQELEAITLRQWPAMRQLDEQSIEEVTWPAVEALHRLPSREIVRRAAVRIVVFRHR